MPTAAGTRARPSPCALMMAGSVTLWNACPMKVDSRGGAVLARSADSAGAGGQLPIGLDGVLGLRGGLRMQDS